MTDFRFLPRLSLAISICALCIGVCNGMLWRNEQSVDYYMQFSSASPFRFSLPSKIREATWTFRATREPDSCDDKNISVYLQYGSLPVVNPHNETFPPDFYLDRTRMTHFYIKTDNKSVTHTELLPLPGDWYAVAFIPEENHQIVQKGLTVQCEYKVSIYLQVEELPPHGILFFGQPTQVALSSNLTESDGTWIGVWVPGTSQALEVRVDGCTIEPCEVQLWTISHHSGEVSVNCSQVYNSTCMLHLPQPRLSSAQHLQLTLLSEGNASVNVEVTSQDCLPSAEGVDEGPNNSSTCVVGTGLDRMQDSEDFSVTFVTLHNNTVKANEALLTNASVTVVAFTLQPVIDIGGTLRVGVSFTTKDMPEDQKVRVCGQVNAGRYPGLTDVLDLCMNTTNNLQVNSSQERDDEGKVMGHIWVPYPEQGPWTLALTMQCYNISNGSVVKEACVNGTQQVELSVGIQSCVDGGCSGQGECKEYIKSSDFIVFSTCQCSAGWRGYGCTDDSEALPDSGQLEEVLLLTLSNLFFLPAIGLAVHRRYYIEAIVYFYNMFFSTFYHACDGDRVSKYVYCMSTYTVLAIGDFLASTVSLWVTLVAMAQLPLSLAAAIQMAGPLALIIGVMLDRRSLWVIAVPCGLGLVLVAVCWAKQCYKGKRCFPEKRRYLWMLPGVLFAVSGAVVFAFFETTKNYKYVHSTWHMCMSLAIVFLLPPRRREKSHSSINFDEADSTEGLVLGPNNYTPRMNFVL